MAVKLNSELDAYFNTGDQPSESNFQDLIDTITPEPVVLTDSAAVTLTKAANQGRLNVVPDLTADSTYTIPTPAAAGEWYKFIYGGAAADAHDFIISLGTSNAVYFKGGVMWVNQNDTSDDGTSIWSDGDSNELLTITAPESFEINLLSTSATVFYLWGWVGAVATPAIAD
jgi:hypothetical protein